MTRAGRLLFVARWALVLMSATMAAPAQAFQHIVVRGESIPRIAEWMYGRVEFERVIVAANRLDGSRGSAIVAGMPLEIPALGHHIVSGGETWHSIAAAHLGWTRRGDVLARLNDAEPWVPPAEGREIVLPYNLRYVARRGDTTQALAYRFLGRRDRPWIIAKYNGLQRARLRHGEVLLIPLHDVQLSEAGRAAARKATSRARSQLGGADRVAQRQAKVEIPKLKSDVRHGRYIEAVARGEALLANGRLTQPQFAAVNALLTVTYVALGLRQRATAACKRWGEADPDRVLDPIEHSPKIFEACTVGVAPGQHQRHLVPAPPRPRSSP
ncbi:MAG: LysM peptidoglycan-binding domain-containing protein [Polyangiaceae bacterium]